MDPPLDDRYDLFVDLVEILEHHGVETSEHRLADAFDPDALVRLLNSSPSIEIWLEIHGIPIKIDHTDVTPHTTSWHALTTKPTTHRRSGDPHSGVASDSFR